MSIKNQIAIKYFLFPDMIKACLPKTSLIKYLHIYLVSKRMYNNTISS